MPSTSSPQNDEFSPHRLEQPDLSPMTSSTSFVYPVKSLFAGKIQPADQTATRPLAGGSRSLSADDMASLVPPSPQIPVNGKSIATAPLVSEPRPFISRSLSSSSLSDKSAKVPTKPRRSKRISSLPSNLKKQSRKAIPNFRHYPAEAKEGQSTPTFSTTRMQGSSTSSQPSPSRAAMETLSSSLAKPVEFQSVFREPRPLSPSDTSSSHAHPLPSTSSGPSAAASGLEAASEQIPKPPTNEALHTPPELPYNPSEYGLVHLGPSSTARSASSQSSNPSSHNSRLSSSISSCKSVYYSVSQNTRNSVADSVDHRLSDPLPEDDEEVDDPELPPEIGMAKNTHDAAVRVMKLENTSATGVAVFASSSAPHSGRSSNHGSKSSSRHSKSGTNSTGASHLSSASVSASTSSSNLRATFRFEHKEDEDGHHVVVGREGKLLRCEDEPIRTPGAVQGFGVLIVVEETEDTLIVRQVSENSTEILGLPPKYLFSLECFTDALPESQAGLLWDNIQFLAEPSPQSGDEELDSPHVFLLTGYGAPEADGIVKEGDHGRRSWTCWCAVHRPPPRAHPGSGRRDVGLIIMELELERDVLNPMYPPVTQVSSVGFRSPDSRGSSTDDSESTLVDSTFPTNTRSGMEDTTSGGSTAQSGQWSPNVPDSLTGLSGSDEWVPSSEDVMESTTSRSKPLLALERLRRLTRTAEDAETPRPPGNGRPGRRRGRPGGSGSSGGVGMMDVFAVMAQINEQLGAAPNLEMFLKVAVGVIKDLTQFHRVMIYQFDEMWNGQVVAELVDWNQTKELYRGLHFPAADIPKQARDLYVINKVRVLYDRAQPTARIIVRDKQDLEDPLDMTHCYLRAMSPIHIKYLANMGVRASMSISIVAFGALWGLVTCHSFGSHGMRVSFPVRQMLRLLCQSISRNIERLSYAQRLLTRKLINTVSSETRPTGYIVSNADDLLGLFDADYGILVIGEGAKILGPNQHGQDILIMLEYLRLKQFTTIHASQAVVNDFPDLQLSTGLEVIAGLLYVPLSSEGRDFIAFLRKGQPRAVHWAGRPEHLETKLTNLEPRKSFKIWSETVMGRCRTWTDEQLETAGVLALVYGKFIEVWRQKQDALQATKLTNLLLANASHEVRTPLNHIINYLEMALNGPLDLETRDNLSRSHAASKSLLFTINDLLDLTRLESGNETYFNEPFDLHAAIEDATHLYQKEAERRSIKFTVDITGIPKIVIGDVKKIQTIVQNLTANALKYTVRGSIKVKCRTFGEPEGLRQANQTAVEILVEDSGQGIAPHKLESIFREFEQVESQETRTSSEAGVGLGLAVVARIVEQLGGQLRADSKLNEGSRFSFLIPLSIAGESSVSPHSSSPSSLRSGSRRNSANSIHSKEQEIDDFVEAMSSDHMRSTSSRGPSMSPDQRSLEPADSTVYPPSLGSVSVTGSQVPLRPVKIDDCNLDSNLGGLSFRPEPPHLSLVHSSPSISRIQRDGVPPKLRVLIVEDNDINRMILAKRLRVDGHTVVNTTNGQEGLDVVRTDQEFDLVLMDIQMPILNGFEATELIRDHERSMEIAQQPDRLSRQLNGRIPIFAVSASLREQQREELLNYGMDGWILKPIDFKRLGVILKGITDGQQRQQDMYRPGNWEVGGWLCDRMGENKASPTKLPRRKFLL